MAAELFHQLTVLSTMVSSTIELFVY